MSTWAWISRRREAEILEKETSHLARILEVARRAVEVVEAFARGDPRAVEEAYRRVKEAEREADRLKDSIIEELSRGLFHPIDREELLRLVLVSDDIADHLNAGTRRLLLASKTGARPPEPILEAMKSIAGIAVESVEKLIEAVRSMRREPSKAVELTRQVERLEERADELRSQAEEGLIEWCNTQGAPGTCMALFSALESLETATDKCEDTADVVRSIAVLQ